MSSFSDDPIMLEVVRNDFVESVHRARLVITAADGSVVRVAGAVHEPMYPRSASKPIQAIAMVESGLDLRAELLALAAASHSGEQFHRDGVREILAGVDLDESVLQNIPDWPTDDLAKIDWIRAGHDAEPIAMNCSGKHAAMIRTCVLQGWPVQTYLDPGHPLQQRIAVALAELSGDPVGAPAVDGCGAPLYPISLAGLARAFGNLAAADGGPSRLVADAIRDHPQWTSGTRRDEAALHRAIPGLVAKAGAEAVYAAGTGDGHGIALKIDDGDPRGRAVLMAYALQSLGFDHPTLTEQSSVPVLGHGKPVGEIRRVPESAGDH